MGNNTNKTLAALQQNGACVTEALHPFDFKIGDAVVPLAVVEIPDAKFRKIIGNKDGYDRAELIAATIRDPDGAVVFTKETAGELKPKFANDLEKLAMKYNGFSDEAEAEGNG